MSIRLSHLFVSAAAATCFGLAAHAADSSWQFAQEEEGPAKVFAQDAGGPSVSLVCSDRFGVQAWVYLDGAADGSTKVDRHSRVKSRNVSISTETTDEQSDKWAYVRSDKLLVSSKGWQGRRMFNSVVKGEPVKLDIFKIGEVTLTLPPVDDQFTQFAQACEATNPSNS